MNPKVIVEEVVINLSGLPSEINSLPFPVIRQILLRAIRDLNKALLFFPPFTEDK